MAKTGKLTKIKSALKKMQSFSLSRNNSSSSTSSSIAAVENSSGDLHAVYVGKSRRRYLVSSEVLENPLLRELVSFESESITVGCEVVLFDHLLWMLENADPQPESLNELVEFYSCS